MKACDNCGSRKCKGCAPRSRETHGRCAKCEKPIKPGDQVKFADGGTLHYPGCVFRIADVPARDLLKRGAELRDQLGEKLSEVDQLLHPNGRCECGGEGRCSWCVKSQGVKFDTGKTALGLFPPEALESIGRVLTYGANKYAAHNWRKGMAWSRYYDALLRHLNAWNAGEDIDPESGLPHLAHAGCCIAFLLASQAAGLGADDRWRKP